MSRVVKNEKDLKNDADKKAPVSYKKLLVNTRQRSNPMLKHLGNVSFEFFSHIIPDFVISDTTCGLFLSIKYHLLYPRYILDRISEIPASYELRFLLCLMDIDSSYVVAEPKLPMALINSHFTNPRCNSSLQKGLSFVSDIPVSDNLSNNHQRIVSPLNDLGYICFNNNMTLIVCQTKNEVARYLETFKLYQNKSPDSLKAPKKQGLFESFSDIVTTIRSVNSSDARTLARAFGSVSDIANASIEQLIIIPGLGEKKVKDIQNAFTMPFNTATAKSEQLKKRKRKDDALSASAPMKKKRFFE